MADSKLTMYTYPGNSRAMKGLVAAEYGGVKVEMAEGFEMGKTNKTAEFLALNPFGKVPTLETPEGGIFESTAIAQYLARVGTAAEQLLGSTVYESSMIDAWCHWANTEVEMPKAAWLYPILGYMPYSKAGTKAAKADMKKILGHLNNHLTQAGTPFLVGSAVTLADIVMACTLLDLYKLVLEPAFIKDFEATNAWFTSVVTQPEFVAAAGETTMCEKMAVYDANKAKKAKAAAAAASSADDPLAALPPSSFDLDAFKNTYSTEDTRTAALPSLWSSFDPEGWTFYKISYKYSADLTLSFSASNLVGVFCQRFPAELAKYGFASMLILGEDNNLKIEGVWLLRGKDIPAMWSSNVDSEHYTMTPLDAANPDHKSMIEDFMAWDGPTFADTTVVDGKVYK